MKSYFKSRDSQIHQRAKNAERNKLKRRLARIKLEETLKPEIDRFKEVKQKTTKILQLAERAMLKPFKEAATADYVEKKEIIDTVVSELMEKLNRR